MFKHLGSWAFRCCRTPPGFGRSGWLFTPRCTRGYRCIALSGIWKPPPAPPMEGRIGILKLSLFSFMCFSLSFNELRIINYELFSSRPSVFAFNLNFLLSSLHFLIGTFANYFSSFFFFRHKVENFSRKLIDRKDIFVSFAKYFHTHTNQLLLCKHLLCRYFRHNRLLHNSLCIPKE